jgi:hypothetical protein
MHLTRKDTLSKKKKAAQGVAINTVAGLNERLLPRFMGNPVALDEMKQASFPQDEYIVLSILPAGKGFVLTSLRILRNVLEADIGWGGKIPVCGDRKFGVTIGPPTSVIDMSSIFVRRFFDKCFL